LEEESFNLFFVIGEDIMHMIEIENYEIRPTEELMLIKPLRDLCLKYKDDADKLLRYLSLIYHYCDPRSSYSYIIDDDDRLQEIIAQEDLGKNFKITKELQNCIDVYKKHIITTSYELLQRTKRAVDKLGLYLDKIDLDERDNNGKPIYTVSTIAQAVKQVPQLAKDLIEAERAVFKEISEQGRARGSQEKSFMDDGINF
jgi:hypothetical protein